MKIKIKRISYFFVLLAVIDFTACRKKADPQDVTPEIELSITAPQEHAVIHKGDTLHLRATVSSPVELHGYSWTIKNKTTAGTIASGEDHEHGKQFTIDDTWVNDRDETIDALLDLSVTIDHEGNTKSKQVAIQLAP